VDIRKIALVGFGYPALVAAKLAGIGVIPHGIISL